MIDVHVKGVLYGIAAALPHMQRRKAGHFINVSSVAGHKIRPAGVVYSATKTAVRVKGRRHQRDPLSADAPGTVSKRRSHISSEKEQSCKSDNSAGAASKSPLSALAAWA